jgi:hypothetical protein
MALQLSYTALTGITSDKAYAMITKCESLKSNTKVNILIYNNKEARDNFRAIIGQIEVKLLVENGATFEQMYEVLKTLPEFAGAINC